MFVNIFFKGVRNKADFSNGRGRRHGKGRHPSGLSGNEIGMWYAAKANRKRKERDLKQVCLINFLLLNLQACRLVSVIGHLLGNLRF